MVNILLPPAPTRAVLLPLAAPAEGRAVKLASPARPDMFFDINTQLALTIRTEYRGGANILVATFTLPHIDRMRLNILNRQANATTVK